MEEKEIWKDIEGYEGYYMVSNLGNVKSLERIRWCGKGYCKIPERLLKLKKNRYDYMMVGLYKDGKRKNYTVHRLVASAFLDNSDNLPEINHIDQDKTNNKVENLEFCDRSYNVNYGTRNRKVAEKLRGRKQSEEHIRKRAKKLNKPVYSIDKESGLVMWWESIREAEKCTGISNVCITRCCKGKAKSAGNFYWHYANAE